MAENIKQTDQIQEHMQQPYNAPPGIMANTLQVDIVSAEKEIFSGRAKAIIVTGEDGELGIFPGHTQILSAIKPGYVCLIDKANERHYYYVSGGFLEAQPDAVTILADTVLRADQIDQEKALAAKERAEKMLATGKRLDDNYNMILIELTKAIAQLHVARNLRK